VGGKRHVETRGRTCLYKLACGRRRAGRDRRRKGHCRMPTPWRMR